MNISDLKKVLDDLEKKYGNIKISTYDEAGYIANAEYVRVFEDDGEFLVFIGEDYIDRHEGYVYEEYIPNR